MDRHDVAEARLPAATVRDPPHHLRPLIEETLSCNTVFESETARHSCLLLQKKNKPDQQTSQNFQPDAQKIKRIRWSVRKALAPRFRCDDEMMIT